MLTQRPAAFLAIYKLLSKGKPCGGLAKKNNSFILGVGPAAVVGLAVQ